MKRTVLLLATLLAAASPLHAVRITEPYTAAGAVGGIAADANSNVWLVGGGSFAFFWAGVDGWLQAEGTAASVLKEVAVAADGSVWATEPSSNKVWRFLPWDPTAAASFTPPTAGSQPTGITAGPDGNIWFTEFAGNRIARITLAGVITEFPVLPTVNAQPNAIVVGPDGNLWFTEYEGNKLGKMSRNGALVAEYPLPLAGAYPVGIAASYGRLYFTESGVNKLGQFVPETSQFIPEDDVPTPGSSPQKLVATGPAELWFTEFLGNRIGHWVPGIGVTEYPIPTATGHPLGIALARNGDVYFTEAASGKIGRVETRVSGDPNADGKIDVTDVFYLINYLFGGGPAPK